MMVLLKIQMGFCGFGRLVHNNNVLHLTLQTYFTMRLARSQHRPVGKTQV